MEVEEGGGTHDYCGEGRGKGCSGRGGPGSGQSPDDGGACDQKRQAHIRLAGWLGVGWERREKNGLVVRG